MGTLAGYCQLVTGNIPQTLLMLTENRFDVFILTEADEK